MFQISNLSYWGPSGLSKSKKFSLTNFLMFMEFFGNELKVHALQEFLPYFTNLACLTKMLPVSSKVNGF